MGGYRGSQGSWKSSSLKCDTQADLLTTFEQSSRKSAKGEGRKKKRAKYNAKRRERKAVKYVFDNMFVTYSAGTLLYLERTHY